MGVVYENASYTVHVNDKPVLSREEDNKYYVFNKSTGVTDAVEDNYPDAVTISNYMDFIINNGVFDILTEQLYEDWGLHHRRKPWVAVVPGNFGKH